MPYGPTACRLAALALYTLPLPCVRSLGPNNLGPEAGMALAEALKSNTTLKTLLSAALPSNPPAHASRSCTARLTSGCVTPFLFPEKHLNTHPARASNATSHSLSPARAQPTHRLHIHRARCLLACLLATSPSPSPLPPTPAPPRVDRGHALLCPRVGGMRVCPLPPAPARRRLRGNDLGDDAEQALKAAARSGLELHYY